MEEKIHAYLQQVNSYPPPQYARYGKLLPIVLNFIKLTEMIIIPF